MAPDNSSAAWFRAASYFSRSATRLRLARPRVLDIHPVFRSPEYLRPRGWIASYAIGIAFMAAALFVRWLLDAYLGDAQPLSLLFGAVALTVWVAGLGPAVLATLFGYFCSDYFFIDPRGVIAVGSTQQMISLVTYVASSAVIIIFGEALRRANTRVSQYARSLEVNQRQLERAEKNKDNFIATLAHELRSPLGAIAHASAFLRSATSSGRARTGPALDIVDRQAQHMQRLIEDLLDLSRIARGEIRLDKRRVALADVVIHSVDASRSVVEKRGHNLVLRVDPRSAFVYGDSTRLTQVLVNLLSNASRYTPEGGTIHVTAEREGQHAVISVSDNGIGIAPEMLERVFELFVQADDARRTAHGGLGIGLALVRKIVQLHDGNVRVHSDGPGCGSEFVVRLPLASDAETKELRSSDRVRAVDVTAVQQT